MKDDFKLDVEYSAPSVNVTIDDGAVAYAKAASEARERLEVYWSNDKEKRFPVAFTGEVKELDNGLMQLSLICHAKALRLIGYG